jgi:cell wall-associated NlpC family hydrolase
VPSGSNRLSTRALPGAFVALLALVAITIGSRPAAAQPGPADNHGRKPSGTANGVDPHLRHRIQTVNAQLDRLARRNDQLDEQYNVAAAAVRSALRSAQRAEQAAGQAAALYRAAHARFLQAVTQQYEGGPNASLGTLLTSDTPQSYLDSLSLSHYLACDFADTVRAEQAAHARAGQAADDAATALAAARAKQAALASRRSALHAELHRFHRVLDTLSARQRRERAHARAVAAAAAQGELHGHQRASALGPVGPVSGTVQRVIAFAEAQVGKSYSYGASGPDAYDCSGLTMASWAQVGVHLPHSAAEQYNYGTHVSYSQLQPGDLIFLYSPIGHVELYVGHDLAVSAADPSMGIVYVHPSQDMADFTGATRLTG